MADSTANPSVPGAEPGFHNIDELNLGKILEVKQISSSKHRKHASHVRKLLRKSFGPQAAGSRSPSGKKKG